MTRALFDDTVTVYQSAGPFIPGPVRFVRPCRLVQQTQIKWDQDPLRAATHYFTWSGPSLFAGAWGPDPDGFWWPVFLNDVVEFSSMPGTIWAVLGSQICTPRGQPPYRRAWIGL